MSKTISLYFSTDGKARCLYTDVIPLQSLGTLKVTRASTIEFNPVSQQWEVVIAVEQLPRFSHRSRETCLQWERDYINKQLHANAN